MAALSPTVFIVDVSLSYVKPKTPVGFLLGWFCRNHAAVSVEVRDTKDYFDDIPDMKLPKDMLQLAEHILETKAGDFEPEKFEDQYENAVVEMLQRKRAGMPVPTERIAAPALNVVSLMDALKRSLAAEEAKAPEPAPKGKKLKKRVAGQREMLLPIQVKERLRRPRNKSRRSPPGLRLVSGEPAMPQISRGDLLRTCLLPLLG